MTQFLFITDLDHTLVGDGVALATLNQRLSQHRKEHGSIIVYSTGRSPTLYQQLRSEQDMIDPDYTVLSVGTLIYPGTSDTPLQAWADHLSDGWDRAAIVAIAAHFSDLVPQPASEQTPHKISYFLDESIAENLLPELESQFRKQNIDVQTVYSGGADLDILPRNGNKGTAVKFLQQQLAIALNARWYVVIQAMTYPCLPPIALKVLLLAMLKQNCGNGMSPPTLAMYTSLKAIAHREYWKVYCILDFSHRRAQG